MKLYTTKYTLGEYSNQMIHVNTNTDFAVGVKVDDMELDKNSICLVDSEGVELSATTIKNDYVVFEMSSDDEPCDKKYAVKFNGGQSASDEILFGTLKKLGATWMFLASTSNKIDISGKFNGVKLTTTNLADFTINCVAQADGHEDVVVPYKPFVAGGNLYLTNNNGDSAWAIDTTAKKLYDTTGSEPMEISEIDLTNVKELYFYTSNVECHPGTIFKNMPTEYGIGWQCNCYTTVIYGTEAPTCDFYLTVDEQKTNIGNVSNTLSTREVQFTGTFADGTEFDYTLFAK